MERIRTLVIDDSALICAAVTEAFAGSSRIEVIGTAADPYQARDRILELDPDVITLDIEMPRMDGLTFLRRIMQHRPMPVIIMSSMTGTGSAKAIEALEAGAVEVIGKPEGGFTRDSALELEIKIESAAGSRLRRRPAGQHDVEPAPSPRTAGSPEMKGEENARHYAPRSVILIGASTGGTEAIRHILEELGTDLPGICIVQHIPPRFSAAFAARLNQVCAMDVREARSGDEIQPGCALVAPGGYHLLLRWTGSKHVVEIRDGPRVHHQRPAVDVLFDSAVKCGAAPYALAMLLTGMGSDGAAGMLRLREAGSRTLAQDEASSVIFGMPREAIRLGAAQEVLSLDAMATWVDRHASRIAIRSGPSA